MGTSPIFSFNSEPVILASGVSNSRGATAKSAVASYARSAAISRTSSRNFLIRDFMRFFPSSGQGSDLKRVVLVPFGPGKAIGFVTAESAAGLGLDGRGTDLVAVYLPMSYMIGGYTVFLPRDVLEPTSLSVEAGMRIALMGGVQGSRAAPPNGGEA